MLIEQSRRSCSRLGVALPPRNASNGTREWASLALWVSEHHCFQTWFSTRSILLFVLSFMLFPPASRAQQVRIEPPPGYSETFRQKLNHTQWWREARFGMFIHFGAYAVPAKGVWLKADEKVTSEEYQRWVDVFRPQDFNPKAWARLAKRARPSITASPGRSSRPIYFLGSRALRVVPSRRVGIDWAAGVAPGSRTAHSPTLAPDGRETMGRRVRPPGL